MKKWEVIGKIKDQRSKIKNKEIIKKLLENRRIKTKKEIEEFLNPKLEEVSAKSVGIKKEELQKALKRIKEAIENKEQIVVFGDYDVDGICGTAILWEALYSLGANVVPYIPHRINEGYGLSKMGISKIKNQKSKTKDTTLIITVDNGIVANEAVDFAKKEGIDIIITDHHIPLEKLPKALAIVHTTKICGAGVAWALAQEIKVQSSKFKVDQENHLELAALATVADMLPLVGPNRTFVRYGLEKLKKTKRVGLLELFKEAVLDPLTIDTYQVGHIIAPRINAMGRLDFAMDSLRLLCTLNQERAKTLAEKIGKTNRERQELTEETSAHAISSSRLRQGFGGQAKLLFICHESYQPGVIGLVAGKLVEEFYRPSIVISKGEKYSKASARSISGFNIIEFLRSASDFLVDCGGHPMAAGFTVETEKIANLQKHLEDLAEKVLNKDHFIRTLRIDMELRLEDIDELLYNEIMKLSPFGIGNPEPTFVSRGVEIEDMRLVGRDGKHLKFQFKIQNSKFKISGIGFGIGEKSKELKIGDIIDVVYVVDVNSWNGTKSLQLKIKDLSKS